MPCLLDTNAWIHYLKQPGSPIRTRLAALQPADVAVQGDVGTLQFQVLFVDPLVVGKIARFSSAVPRCHPRHLTFRE